MHVWKKNIRIEKQIRTGFAAKVLYEQSFYMKYKRKEGKK